MSVSIENGVIARLENACWDELALPHVPAQLEFIALLRLLGQPEDFAEDARRDIEAYLTGPGMEHLASIEFEVPSWAPSPEHPEGWEMNMPLAVIVQFTAQAEGTHVLDFYVNCRHENHYSVPFRIKIAEPQNR
jgi:hypothetical protein